MTAMLSTKRIETLATSGTSTPQQTSSADVIGSNDDLLTEILLRFPIKSLLKFKSVSKHWLSLISDPYFSRRRNPNPNSISGLLLHKSTCIYGPEFEFVPLHGKPSTAPPFRSLAFVDDPAGISILQSCNGLLCCCSYQEGEPKRNYYIYNPTTQQFTILPKLGGLASSTVAGVILAFDPSKSLHYKVVCVRTCDSFRYRIEIYSSETGSWRQSGDPFTAPRNINFYRGDFWNGAIHWISNFGTTLSFDVNQEQLREMPMPEIPGDWHWRRIRYFGESRDHLHLILINGPLFTHLNVYEMEKNYSRWFLKYQVDLDAVTTAFPEMSYCDFTILCLVREENDQESFLVLQIPQKAICYSFKDKTFKKLCDLADRR